MYTVAYSNKIKKDIRLAQKRGLDLELFKEIVRKLEIGDNFPKRINYINLAEIMKDCGNVISNPIGF